MLKHQLTDDPHWIDQNTLADQFAPQEMKDARRCVIREINLNLLSETDIASLHELIEAFCAQEEYFLRLLESKKFRRYGGLDGGFRELRDAIVQGEINIEMRHGLQARHWKLALDNAIQTTRSHWALVQTNIRSRLYRSCSFYEKLNDAEKKYVNDLAYRVDDRFFDMLDGKTPLPADTAGVRNPKGLCAKIRSVVRAVQGKFPHMQSRRVCTFDVSCYRVKTLQNGNQVVKLMSLVPFRKIKVTLPGTGKIEKTIRLVRSEKGLALHVLQTVKTKSLNGIPKPAKGKKLWCVGADMGVTEVFTDDTGNQYGCDFGEVLKEEAEWLNRKLAQRNKLYALLRKTDNPHKRANILRFNLGKKRYRETMRRFKTRLANIVNRAINSMFKRNPADVYLLEQFGSLFKYPQYISAQVRYKLTLWIRGIIRERMEFKAFVNNVRLFYVPAAYTSQRCPICGYVSRKNRSGDSFRCQKCDHTDQADRNGAKNILMAPHHGFITKYTGKDEIKAAYMKEYKEIGVPYLTAMA